MERTTAWGYPPIVCSVDRRLHLHQLSPVLQGRVSVVVGPSGVGKSSLINTVLSEGLGFIDTSEPAGKGSGVGLEKGLEDGSEEGLREVLEDASPSGVCSEHDVVTEGERSDAGESAGVVVVEEESEALSRSSDGGWIIAGGAGVRGGEGGEGGDQQLTRNLQAGLLREGVVSKRSGRGRHTTRHVALVRIPEPSPLSSNGIGPRSAEDSLVRRREGMDEMIPGAGSCRQPSCDESPHNADSQSMLLDALDSTACASGLSGAAKAIRETAAVGSLGDGPKTLNPEAHRPAGYLADSPGFNQPSLADVTTANLASLFPEVRTANQARFLETSGILPPSQLFADVVSLLRGWARLRAM